MNDTITVAGATGYIGRHVVAALDTAGHRVRALVRSRSRAEEPGSFGSPGLAGHVAEWRIVDYAAPDTLRDVCDGSERVVSALGVTRQPASPWDIDFQGNLRVLESAERAGAQSFLYVNVLHADAGTSDILRAKNAFSEVLRRSAVRGQIVNPSGYFSDMTDFLTAARRGMGFTLGEGTRRLNPIHGADLADFIVARIDGPAGIWDVGGPEIFSYHDLEELVFRIAGRKPRIVKVGPRAAGTLQWLADRGSPRAGMLMRFFLESLDRDGVGVPTGERRLEPFLRAVPA